MDVIMTLYVVRNKEGKYFHAKGYGGYGDTWVDDIRKAKVYPKIGQAHSRCTWFANEYPKYGIPDIVELHVTSTCVLDQEARVKKAQEKKAKEDAKRKLEYRKWQLEEAKKIEAESQAEIKKLSKLIGRG